MCDCSKLKDLKLRIKLDELGDREKDLEELINLRAENKALKENNRKYKKAIKQGVQRLKEHEDITCRYLKHLHDAEEKLEYVLRELRSYRSVYTARQHELNDAIVYCGKCNAELPHKYKINKIWGWHCSKCGNRSLA